MFKIELTRGTAWDAAVVEEHPVQRALHIGDVERMAQLMLTNARRSIRAVIPTDYRIIDALGRHVRSSATRAQTSGWVRQAARTCWS